MGFIAYDEEGRLRAAAFGVPPPWIRSIHGAELWALFAAIRIAVPGVLCRSDRKAVVDTYRAGRALATRGGDEHARLWNLIFTVCEGGGPSEVVWMPAHTSAADVGRARLSDGSTLTTRDREANDAADHLAKRGAELHRVPKHIRKEAKLKDLLATWAARLLAVATHAANNAPGPLGHGLLRDSSGLSRRDRKKLAAERRTVADNLTAASAPCADPSDPPRQSQSGEEPPVLPAPVGSGNQSSSKEEEELVLVKWGRCHPWLPG